jgi:hypothetical protein
MIHPEFSAVIARQRQHQRLSEASARRAAKTLVSPTPEPERARGLRLAWPVLLRWRHAG